ncbi:MAG: efflux RND transporter permease subunit [Candidatus Coatesbacteria bacterium]
MNLASLAVRRPTFVMAIFTAMIVVGLLSLSKLGVDMFPEVNLGAIVVTTVYRGAGPHEVEELVSKPLEEELSSLPGLKHVTSINQDGFSMVVAEFRIGVDIKDAEQQLRARVSVARSKLPADIDEPVVRRFDPADAPIAKLALRGDLPPADMYDVAREVVKPRLEQVLGAAVVDILGGSRREIQVLLDREKLKRHELALSTVAMRVAASSSNVPLGKVSEGRSETAFRTIGEYRSLDRLKKLAVSFYASDVAVSLGDLGQVVETTEDPKTYAYLNGAPALFLSVYRQAGSNTVAVVDGLVARMGDINRALAERPGHLKLHLVVDNAKFIRLNINDVVENILLGIILAVIVVYFFLGSARSTFVTVMALPNSLIGTFILLYAMGLTINMITLLAFSLAIGLLVDDAIVVRENIWRHLEEGQSPRVAAVAGTREVTMAVVATSLTVIAVFLPIGFLGGMVGQFFRSLGFTVVFAMSVSLFDAMTMAPLLSAYLAGKASGAGDDEEAGWARRAFLAVCAPFSTAAAAFGRFQDRLVDWYEDVIRFSLRHRALIVALAVLLFLGSLAVGRFLVKFTFMPNQNAPMFQVTLEAAPDTSLAAMREECLKVERIIRDHKENVTVALEVGNVQGESNVGYIYVEMTPYGTRKISGSEMRELIRKELKPYARLNPRIGDVQMVGHDRPFEMNLTGDDLDALGRVAEASRAEFRKIKDLVDVDMDYRAGKPEFQVVLDPDRMAKLGVSTVTAGMELRGMVDGVVPAKYRIGGLEYDIRVRLREGQRDLREGLAKFWVPNMNFQLVRLSNVASQREIGGPTKINRRDRERFIQINAEMARGGALGSAQNASRAIMAKMKIPKGVHYEFTGMGEELRDLMKNFVIAMVLALVFMYMILASLYESMVMPFLILVAVPLAIVGALCALAATRLSLDIFSMIGLVMLLGLVAKNSILLVDFTIQLTRKGMPREQALIRAGRIRLRPILMTTITLIAGMLPLAMALTEVGSFRQSLGVAVIGGLISSVVLTLVVVPAVYTWFDDLRLWLRRSFGRPVLRVIDESDEETPSSRRRGRA